MSSWWSASEIPEVTMELPLSECSAFTLGCHLEIGIVLWVVTILWSSSRLSLRDIKLERDISRGKNKPWENWVDVIGHGQKIPSQGCVLEHTWKLLPLMKSEADFP